jgi:hypothetical protein
VEESATRPGSFAQDGSSPASAAAEPSSPPPDPVRRTRLQHGIRKTKVYTDGTVRYGCLTTTEEPVDLQEALSNKDWKNDMDAEYMALARNKNMAPCSTERKGKT